MDDRFARAFAGFASDDELLKALNAISYPDFRLMRTLFVLRSRYAEDELARLIKRGISQYIILGAGLDSFAYRRPDTMRELDVFEVDHPASQSWKRAGVAELKIGIPARLHYAPIDFERETLSAGLARAGISSLVKARNSGISKPKEKNLPDPVKTTALTPRSISRF